jgi:uncharacterized protein
VRALLDEDDYTLFARRFGLDREPNFEGRWNPHVYVDYAEQADETGIDAEELQRRIDTARARLFQARERRVRPGRRRQDPHQSWNGS